MGDTTVPLPASRCACLQIWISAYLYVWLSVYMSVCNADCFQVTSLSRYSIERYQTTFTFNISLLGNFRFAPSCSCCCISQRPPSRYTPPIPTRPPIPPPISPPFIAAILH